MEITVTFRESRQIQKYYNVYFQSYGLDAHLVCKRLQRSVEQGAGNVGKVNVFSKNKV